MLAGKGIISQEQKAIMQAFSVVPDADRFYLTGGTALAEFYFAHRRSHDLDFFTTEQGLVLPFSRALEAAFQRQDIGLKSVRRLNSFAEYVCRVEDKETRLQIAYDSPYRLNPAVESEYGILVNDYEDLVVDKLLAFFGRWTHRDAVDLYFILEKENLQDLLAQAKMKDPGFDLYWLAVALKQVEAFPDQIGDWDVSMLVPLDVTSLKDRLVSLSQELLGRFLGDSGPRSDREPH